MSYVRFSTDGFRSDVYCYANLYGGYTLHVAGNRYDMTKVQPPPPGPTKVLDAEELKAWVSQYRAHHSSVREAGTFPINLPGAGETYNFASLDDLKDKLTELKLAGFVVPDSAFERIDAEIAEERKE